MFESVEVHSKEEVPVTPSPILWHVNPKQEGSWQERRVGWSRSSALGEELRREIPGSEKCRPVLAGWIIQGTPIVGSRMEMSIHQ